jgi:hypothetical protein
MAESRRIVQRQGDVRAETAVTGGALGDTGCAVPINLAAPLEFLEGGDRFGAPGIEVSAVLGSGSDHVGEIIGRDVSGGARALALGARCRRIVESHVSLQGRFAA